MLQFSGEKQTKKAQRDHLDLRFKKTGSRIETDAILDTIMCQPCKSLSLKRFQFN